MESECVDVCVWERENESEWKDIENKSEREWEEVATLLLPLYSSTHQASLPTLKNRLSPESMPTHIPQIFNVTIHKASLFYVCQCSVLKLERG